MVKSSLVSAHINKPLKQLIELVRQESHSASHQVDHLARVAEYGRQLAEMYGADVEVVQAAAWVHDLGRRQPEVRGAQSAQLGAELAVPLLQRAGFEVEQVDLIVRVVAEHDQPELHSELLESRILKDADFLDGFGAWGVVRSLIYAGETGGGVAEALERLQRKTRQRLEGLEFVESRRRAWRQTRLTEYLVSQLTAAATQAADLSADRYPGKLVVFEGLSGTGKDTQLARLAEWLEQQGQVCTVLNHPTEFFKDQIWQTWRSQTQDPASELCLLLADRIRIVSSQLWPALRAGHIVLSSRSGISSQVYQPSSLWPLEWHRLAFQFEPLADVVIYLKLDPTTAASRSQQRGEADFFKNQSSELAQRYAAVLQHYPNVQSIDASGSIDEVHQRVVACVQSLL